MVRDGQLSVERLCWVRALTKYKENFLVNLNHCQYEYTVNGEKFIAIPMIRQIRKAHAAQEVK